MDNSYVKKLTGKDPKDYEFAASHIINNSDVEAFSALVEKSDFLFDFIKENVKKRLQNVVTNYNYKNLLNFLDVYSSDYEDVIVSTLVKFADEDLTDEMLTRLESGSDSEKAYSAKYFSKINDTLALDLLRKHSYSEFSPLAMNSAEALAALGDKESYERALEKLDSADEFEVVSAVNFLISYGNQDAIAEIFKVMKKTSMPENIASEIPYLKSFSELLEGEFKLDTILALDYIIDGLGEIISLDQIFSVELYDILQNLSGLQLVDKSSAIATLFLSSKLKFEQLTENDEYVFDEDKIVKEEVYAIKELLLSFDEAFYAEQKKLILNELNENSQFLFIVLQLVQDLNLLEAIDCLKNLLNASSQTIILKAVEVINSLNKLNELDKNSILEKITDDNIKYIITSLFD